jgi:ribokinase
MRGDDARDSIRDDVAVVVTASGAGVVCTAGSAGAFVWSGDGVLHVPPSTVTAVDSTAAGDTFIGYLAAGLTVDPLDLIGAIRYAVRAAAVAVTRPGAIDSIPYRYELETTEECP